MDKDYNYLEGKFCSIDVTVLWSTPLLTRIFLLSCLQTFLGGNHATEKIIRARVRYFSTSVNIPCLRCVRAGANLFSKFASF
jgi:hypothetical protein